MRVRREKQRRARIEVIPLIDVTFLLLVFFIYLSMTMTIHRGIPVRLPEATTAERDRTEAVEVSVDRNGQVFVNRDRVALEDLEGVLRSRIGDQEEDRVILRGDKRAAYEHIMDVLDRIRQAGVARVSLDAQGRES